MKNKEIAHHMGITTKAVEANMYQGAIRTSVTAKSVADETFINPYIHSSNIPVPYDAGSPALTDITLAFSADPETKPEQSMTQKWIAIYPNCREAWVGPRRTGYPKNYGLLFSDNPDVGTDEIMRSIQSSYLEADTNPEGLAGALALSEMQGGNKNNANLWWDKK